MKKANYDESKEKDNKLNTNNEHIRQTTAEKQQKNITDREKECVWYMCSGTFWILDRNMT